MSSFNSPYSSSHYAPPSAPALPESYDQQQSSSTSHRYNGQQLGYPPSSSGYGYGSSGGYPPAPPPASIYGGVSFPQGTNSEIIRSFHTVDKDRSGFIDERELQEALSFGYQKFSLRTVRLLMFLFKNTYDPLRIGPNEFAALWSCLGQWRGIFERFDRDRSGKIDSMELKDALLSLGYAVPPSVLQLLISKYDDGSGRRGELNFDSFVECGMIVKGLTEKFKEKDPRYTGSATLSYETFMTMIMPFLVSY
ncbi:probable calcium-binding protein CML48 [Papaver somniferum]|nr:probable calcium-binding protein CML48 [Papaver somniferum]